MLMGTNSIHSLLLQRWTLPQNLPPPNGEIRRLFSLLRYSLSFVTLACLQIKLKRKETLYFFSSQKFFKTQKYTKVHGKCSTFEVINYSGRSSHEQPLLIFTNAPKWSGAFLSENEADDLIKPLLYFGEKTTLISSYFIITVTQDFH